MTTPPRRASPWLGALLLTFIGSCIASAAGAAEPRRVLLLHSFGRNIAPYAAVATAFRTELARGRSGPVAVYELALDAVRTGATEDDAALIELLRHRFANSHPDLVVTFGPPAARFFQRSRDQLFPGTPMLISAVDERIVRASTLRQGDAVVAGRIDLPAFVEHILQLLPGTRTIAVVLGDSPLERFWLGEARRELAPFEGQVSFLWLNDRSLEEMREAVASLPPHSAVLYTLLVVDAAGVPHEGEIALASLREVSTAPIFGMFESQIGMGIVGGPIPSQQRHGKVTAETANRMLSGVPATGPAILVTGLESTIYDWRELERWGIDRKRTAPGSEIRFRPPSPWEQHRVPIVAGLSILLLQTAMLAGLISQRARLRRAEAEARDLSGRLIGAHEDERRRIARELHDDITQRLARLSIDAANLQGGGSAPDDPDALHAIREGLTQLSEDVHALSYRLHPSVLDDLGLAEALRAEGDRVARCESIRVDVLAPRLPQHVPRHAMLCIYRVAQEALRNVSRHARAGAVKVALALEDGGLLLSIGDDGIGFDVGATSPRPSLGLASMRERVRLLGGRLEIQSKPGAGTTVVAWVPCSEGRP